MAEKVTIRVDELKDFFKDEYEYYLSCKNATDVYYAPADLKKFEDVFWEKVHKYDKVAKAIANQQELTWLQIVTTETVLKGFKTFFEYIGSLGEPTFKKAGQRLAELYK